MTLRGLAGETRWMDATALAHLVRSEEVKAVELVEAAIERIEAHNPALNAVVTEWFEHARSAAADGPPGGPFSGVPFLLKDFMAAYAGQAASSNGNHRLKELTRPVSGDSTMVARLRAAGLVTVGRTNTPEFASQPTTEPAAWGATRNPWDPAYSTGGSSGGAAAAVASGMVPFAHASDGSGSIRIPAACCGLVGLKPSRGRISAGPSGDESGPAVELCVSRTVRDTAALLDAVQGPGVGDLVVAPQPSRPYTDELAADPAPLRIGVLDHAPGGDPVHPDCAAAVHEAAALLEELGHRVEISWPAVFATTTVEDAGPLGLAATSPMANSFAHLAEVLGREVTAADVEPVTWARLQRLRRTGATDVARAQAASTRYRRDVQQWWADGHDLLLTPTTADPAPRIGSFGDDLAALEALTTRYVAFTRPFNITGQPAISLPLSRTASGLPVGVQLAAAYGCEDVLIAVAAQLERARPWAHTFSHLRFDRSA
ncbi:amidase [Amycolatopsis sp. NPDC005961]|uniref:amidase n=1 Tax=Amycolatopsis sp. NPDC005961 TaxID=3156720 RepID=UPI0033CC1E62